MTELVCYRVIFERTVCLLMVVFRLDSIVSFFISYTGLGSEKSINCYLSYNGPIAW